MLVGRSGIGKSTLLRALAGLIPLRSGEIYLAGRRLDTEPVEVRSLGVVFQEPALFLGLSVLENAAFGLKIRKIEDAERRAREGLERVGLTHVIHTPVHRLSGGERQRLALVRALVWDPQALVLDEPFSALDTETRDTVRRSLISLLEVRPVPVILVTHRPSDGEGWTTQTLKVDEHSIDPQATLPFGRVIVDRIRSN